MTKKLAPISQSSVVTDTIVLERLPSSAELLSESMLGAIQLGGDAKSAEIDAYQYILLRIRHGQLGPGARVRTEDIASAMGLSRQPIREAVRRLEAEGYLTSRPNRGAIVSHHTPAQLLELFEIRASLEGLASRIIAGSPNANSLASLDSLLTPMESAGLDTNTWLALHMGFHIQLATIANRPRLMQEISRLHAALEPYIRLWYIHAGTPENAREEHQELIRSLRSGYPNHAEEVMRDHVLETAPQIVAHLEASGQATV